MNLFPVSLFFGADFVLGGVVAHAPAILFGPAWGALSMGLASLSTLPHWQDPFFPPLMALFGFTIGAWLHRYRSRVVEGALLVGLLGAPIAFSVYLHMWPLPLSGVLVITVKVIVNFMADVVICSHLLRASGLEARLNPRAGSPWDMRAYLANILSLVVFLSLGSATVFFGNAEYRRVKEQAAADVKLLTERARHDLDTWMAARQRTLEALATTIDAVQDPDNLQQWLSFFRTINPDFVQVEVVSEFVAAGLSVPLAAEAGQPILHLTAKIQGVSGFQQGYLSARISLASLDLAAREGEQGRILLLDQAGRVVTAPPRWPLGTRWQITDLGVPHLGFQDVIAVLPDTSEDILVHWQNGQLVHTVDEPAYGWQIVGLLPLGPYQNRLFFAYEVVLLAGLGLLIPFTLTINWVSRWLTRPLEKVAATAKLKLIGDRQVEWPAPGRIAEVNVLVSHLSAAEDALTEAHNQLIKRNQALEEVNRNLEQMVTSDALTGLGNRRVLDGVLDLELKRARSSRRSSAVLMIDLDRFKAVNDTYGHPVGDAALRTVARTIESCKRESDLVARYGGDELAVVLFDMARDDALEVAERIRAAVQAAPVTTPAGTVHVTVSVGVAVFPEHGETPSAVFAAADRALYYAKTAGRNRVSLYTPS